MSLHRVGVIGWPIAHSISPAIHQAAFAALGMEDWSYDAMAIPPDIVRQSLRELRDHAFIGVNVTIPHKQTVMLHVRPDPLAQRIGAVNTIDLRTNRGTNTDVGGFMGDLQAHGIAVSGAHIVVLGAGGAARAAVYGLSEAGARLTIVNRTPERALQMISTLGVEAAVGSFEAVEAADVIVNCTSAGMTPDIDASPLPEDVLLMNGVIGYDMVYRPTVTRFMQQVKAAGGTAIGGVGMLVRQAAAAFTLWTERDAPLSAMFDAAQASLGE